MKYVIAAVAICYALLCLYAAARQPQRGRRRRNTALMITGGVVLLFGTIVELNGWAYAWLIVLIGALLTCQSALYAAKDTGRTKLQHHALRFLISAFLILGTILW